MELQELTTDELMNIEGGDLRNFFYDAFYVAFRTIRLAGEMSNSLNSNPNFGNAMVYK